MFLPKYRFVPTKNPDQFYFVPTRGTVAVIFVGFALWIVGLFGADQILDTYESAKQKIKSRMKK